MYGYLPILLWEDHVTRREAHEDGPVVVRGVGAGVIAQQFGVGGDGADVVDTAVVVEERRRHVRRRPVGAQVASGGRDGVVIVLDVAPPVRRPRGREELHGPDGARRARA